MNWIFDSVPPATTPKHTRQEPPCAECCGEGFVEMLGGPGYFSELEECWMPSEDIEPCAACRGTGVQELDELDGPTSAETNHHTHGHVEAEEGAEPALPF